MDVVHRRSSSSSPSGSALNPNAPLFVPMAYRAVEDFSDQWFQLVESSASFRGYWFLQQQQQQQQKQQQQQQQRRRSDGEEPRGRDFDDVLLADEDSLFHGYQPVEEEKRYARDVAAFQSSKWGGPLSPVDKAVQFASLRTSPWTLQRPI